MFIDFERFSNIHLQYTLNPCAPQIGKKSLYCLTTLCAFISSFRSHEGHMFRKVMVKACWAKLRLNRNLLMRWVYYIALLRTYSFCVCAQCVRVKPNKRMSNWTKLFLGTVRIYCVSYCYIVAHSKFFILFLVDFMKNDYRKKPD